jgi:hypothetical protein
MLSKSICRSTANSSEIAASRAKTRINWAKVRLLWGVHPMCDFHEWLKCFQLVGVSYSTSREWFHIQNFTAFNGVVFWEDFVMWRQRRTGVVSLHDSDELEKNKSPLKNHALNLPAKSRKFLSQL